MHAVGVLLAAGSSRRMGRLKQLLPFGDHAVLEQGVFNYRAAGVGATVVVLGHAPGVIRAALPDLFASDDVRSIVNDRHEEGMFSSVQCGVAAASHGGYDAALLSLVDQPFIPPSVYTVVLDAHATTGALVTIPTFDGRRGHPVALSSAVYDAILSPDDPSTNLREIIRAHEEDTHVVPVNASEILRDMDLPAEYADELRRWLSGRREK